ncbi:Gfo/Idh/MocA family oxidoreductase [Cohnella boryungensis]|uniref:Gfo/Idh/MocA family oxidoreductase n=1 Tax=Cohnella boryungensis TaxID=768479 RepID=UPI00366C26BF
MRDAGIVAECDDGASGEARGAGMVAECDDGACREARGVGMVAECDDGASREARDAGIVAECDDGASGEARGAAIVAECDDEARGEARRARKSRNATMERAEKRGARVWSQNATMERAEKRGARVWSQNATVERAEKRETRLRSQNATVERAEKRGARVWSQNATMERAERREAWAWSQNATMERAERRGTRQRSQNAYTVNAKTIGESAEMEQKKVYTLGVVGLGEGRSIMSAALQSERWKLVKVCDLNEEICAQRAKEFGFSEWTTDYQELLDDPTIEVIAIYTPDQLHLKHVCQALEAGKHVVCTKPLLPSLEGAKELIEVQQRTGKKVFVGQSTRFFEPMIKQREDYDQGRNGDLETVEAHYITDGRWFLEKAWSRQKGFSWMYGFMIHAVDLVRWYLPEVSEVAGFGRSSANNAAHGLETWDSMRFILRDEQGRIATVAGSYTLPTFEQAIEPSISCVLRGTKGTTRGEYPSLRYNTHFEGEGNAAHAYEEKDPYYFRFEGKSHHAGEYQNYIEYFADCLDSDATPLPDVHEAVRTLALMEAMERSMRSGGQVVRVQAILDEYWSKGQ